MNGISLIRETLIDQGLTVILCKKHACVFISMILVLQKSSWFKFFQFILVFVARQSNIFANKSMRMSSKTHLIND